MLATATLLATGSALLALGYWLTKNTATNRDKSEHRNLAAIPIRIDDNPRHKHKRHF